MVIDLSQLRRVTIDAGARIATVAGGATAAEVADAAAGHGLAAVVGMTGRLGMAGLTLAGGYGPLTGRFGLALDNLVGADVVLEDGRRVQVDAASEPELYWALRGGGGQLRRGDLHAHPVASARAGAGRPHPVPVGGGGRRVEQARLPAGGRPPGAHRAERGPGRGRRRPAAVPVPGLERRPGAGREADRSPATAGQRGGLPGHPHHPGRDAGPGQLPLGPGTPLRGPHLQRRQPHAGCHPRAGARGGRDDVGVLGDHGPPFPRPGDASPGRGHRVRRQARSTSRSRSSRAGFPAIPTRSCTAPGPTRSAPRWSRPPCRARSPDCAGRTTAARSRTPTATTPPGCSPPGSATPRTGCSRPRRCRTTRTRPAPADPPPCGPRAQAPAGTLEGIWRCPARECCSGRAPRRRRA